MCLLPSTLKEKNEGVKEGSNEKCVIQIGYGYISKNSLRNGAGGSLTVTVS